jgi:ribosomal protein S12 methylthiotransferase
MRRWGDGRRFLDRIGEIRDRWPEAAMRSSFIVGYPGETEEDHDRLLAFVEEGSLDWAGFFAFSPEEGTYAAGLPDRVGDDVVGERLRECCELQDAITARRRHDLVGRTIPVLVDAPGVARGHREAPEIDGVVRIPPAASRGLVGRFVDVTVTGAAGPDLDAVVV